LLIVATVAQTARKAAQRLGQRFSLRGECVTPTRKSHVKATSPPAINKPLLPDASSRNQLENGKEEIRRSNANSAFLAFNAIRPIIANAMLMITGKEPSHEVASPASPAMNKVVTNATY
jgi:hypothetical protein